MLPEYFEFLNPVKMLCGSGALENIPYELDRLGVKKPLALVSSTLLEEGIIERIGGKLEAVIQSDIPKDSSFSLVDSVAKRAREEGCDGVLAIGGGSVLDTAKAVRALLSQGERTLRAMLGSEWLTRGQPVPFVMVPTTSGTGSECTGVAVVQDDRSRLKQEIVSDQFLPDVAVLDPRSTKSLPPRLTAASGMDALTHAIEAYVSVDANPVTDAAAIQSIKLIAENLRQAVANGANVKARENMAYASYLAGLAFNNGNLGYVHAMAHQLGGQYDMAHGVSNAMLLPTVEEYNLISNPEKFRDIAVFMGKNVDGLSVMEAAHLAVDAMRELAEDVGIPSGLAQMGVKEEDFDLMATNALKDGNAFSNPRKGTKQDIIDMFRKAM